MTTPPPDILFMGRIFEVPWGGVREMAEELLRAAASLPEAAGRRFHVLVPRAGMCPVGHPSVGEVVLPRFAGNRILWDHVTVRAHANARRNAVLYNIKLVLPEGLRIPGFTSLHDLMYFPQPAKYDWREYLLGDSLYMRVMVRRTVRRAPLTHTDSVYTAEDARALFPGVDPGRFRPVPLGVRADRWGAVKPGDEARWQRLGERGVRPPFVFHSGGLSRRKNVRVLAGAFGQFLAGHPGYQLVLTGGSKPTVGDPALQQALEALPPGGLLRLGAVDQDDLRLLYQRAAFFAFPSLYEGFGLPPLEAQAAGCPVICSNATSLPEVVGQSALLFDPRSPRDLLDCMERVVQPETRARLVEAGRQNAARFRWEETARRWLQLADEVYRLGTQSQP